MPFVCTRRQETALLSMHCRDVN